MIRPTGIAILWFLPACVAFCQSGNRPAFEVAVVKPNTSNEDPKKQGKGRFQPGGRIELPDRTLKALIMSAYDVQSEMITGGPKWLDSDRFDILAKAPPEADQKMLQTMLQTLLADRFKLVTHREDRVMPEFALVVGKSGPKLERSLQPGQQNCSWKSADVDDVPARRECGRTGTAGAGAHNALRRRVCRNTTMTELAKALPGWGGIGIDRPVVDLTGLKGEYDFQLEISRPRPNKPGFAEDTGPTIFDALAHLGLKLESRRAPMAIIVIDHVERVPTEN